MLFFRKTKKQQTESSRSKRISGTRPPFARSALDRKQLTNLAIYSLFTLLTVLICFLGLNTSGPAVQRNQISRIRIVADIDFSYVSQIQTAEALEARRQQIPPVYQLSLEKSEEHRDALRNIFAKLIEYADLPVETTSDIIQLTEEEFAAFIQTDGSGVSPNLRSADLLTVYNKLGPRDAMEAVREGIILLSEINRQGIYSPDQTMLGREEGRLSLFHVEDENGNVRQVEILSHEEALRSLRIHLSALDVPREVSIALFRLLRPGLEPNLHYDSDKTNELIEQASENIQPVQAEVRAGETLIEPNTRVSPLQYEKLEAYRRAFAESQRQEFGVDTLFIERAILTLFVVMAAAFYLRTSQLSIKGKNRVFILCGALILFNLLIVRLVLEIGNSALAQSSPLLAQLIPYFLPIALGPIILAILVGSGPAVVAAALIAVFNAMMQGNSLTVLIASTLSAMAGIQFCHNIQVRSRVVRAGFYAGAILAFAVLFIGIRDSIEIHVVLLQLIAAMGTGLFTGIIVVGLLPIWEGLFKYTTDITLLELTDFNHPLLRKMQVEAPGSYHHSLMVANLSENAAAAIGANPLICRVCALFHDIGKMAKPEYFAENQRSGHNPHIERNPSMSALVIKSHVKEGIQLAKSYKLPEIIRDVIRQHHGTSLIQYFYYKALEKQKEQNMAEGLSPNAPRIELDTVNEGTYRYEGPIPQFTESAVIMLADSIEAASRSLRKVTPQSIEELVDKIVTARLEDGQLDDTAMTFAQLGIVRESFTFTLLNMLHARVEYPEEAKESEKKAKKKQAREARETASGLPGTPGLEGEGNSSSNAPQN